MIKLKAIHPNPYGWEILGLRQYKECFEVDSNIVTLLSTANSANYPAQFEYWRPPLLAIQTASGLEMWVIAGHWELLPEVKDPPKLSFLEKIFKRISDQFNKSKSDLR